MGDSGSEVRMRPRVLAAVLVSGLVVFAGPAWSQGPGGGHGGGGHPSGGSHSSGGGHAGAGGHAVGGSHGGAVGHTVRGNHGTAAVHTPGGAHHWGGVHSGWGEHHGSHGYRGWGGHFRWSSPFWWGGYLGWGWPFAYYGYYGPGYDGPGYYGSTDAGEPGEGLTPVDTDVSPEEALVYLNGVLIGTADDFDGNPDYLYLGPGHYTLEFRMPGYRSRTLELDAEGEAKIPVDFELEREPGGGATEPYRPPQGLPHGRVFGPDFGHAMTPHRHGPDPTLRPELRQGYRRGGDAVAAPHSTTSAPGLAALKLLVSPPNAAVYLDGEFQGSGVELGRLQRGVAVSPGAHRIEVLAPGHAPKSVQVDAEQGKEQQLTVELEPSR
jgi:hypothetical protein